MWNLVLGIGTAIGKRRKSSILILVQKPADLVWIEPLVGLRGIVTARQNDGHQVALQRDEHLPPTGIQRLGDLLA